MMTISSKAKFWFISFFREKVDEKGYYELNSRIIGSLIFPPASSQTLDVSVTFQHVKVRKCATIN